MDTLTSIWNALIQACEWLCSPLVPFGTGLKDHLATLSLSTVRGALALAFVALAVWSLQLPKAYVMEGAPYSTWWNDPRRWAALVMIVLIVLYLTL